MSPTERSAAEPAQEPTGDVDLVVRPATPDDAVELAELYLATRRAAEPGMPPQVHTADEVRAYHRRVVAEDEVWVAAGSDGSLLGYLVLQQAWLHSLYVGPDHQGTGIGSVLLDLAKQHRPEGFSLWVFASNAPARGFYRRHGLVELEHTDGSANEERSPDVRMAWPGIEPMAFLRGQIHAVDDELAVLLARRQALTAAVQGHKGRAGDRAGHAGRDPERERAIAERMARHAPGLGVDGIGRVVDAVISVSLDAWEKRRDTSAGGPGPEVG
ncbi:MAG TPA: GNAT family N-acetyltransferase [Segeticoccus sp.]|uniref:GNAT family N-acetyltransferase n=1 Tax=Segeticoccus sp. TaxID=2706531 RepID=UPI002D808F59|nr:GNAT family N-acetyltransferase [Segeticoccus sp.]HET8599695.1 GNAT family N-acetyltransferase [Segeticoccus sp.]